MCIAGDCASHPAMQRRPLVILDAIVVRPIYWHCSSSSTAWLSLALARGNRIATYGDDRDDNKQSIK